MPREAVPALALAVSKARLRGVGTGPSPPPHGSVTGMELLEAQGGFVHREEPKRLK